MDLAVSVDHRLVQVFMGTALSDTPPVFEVYVHTDSGEFVCTCGGFRIRKRCKHIDWEVDLIRKIGIIGPRLPIETEIDPDEFDEVIQDPAQFRMWVLRNADIIVIT